jgi:hypothetical protein
VNFPGFMNEDGTTTPATLPGVMKSNVNKLLLK